MMKHSVPAPRFGRVASVLVLLVVALLSLGQGANAGSPSVKGKAAPKGVAHFKKGDSVPEINPALLAGTAVLVVGAALILTDRARARRPA